MNRNEHIEEEFIRSFVIKLKREHALFDLASPKKRDRFLGKLCHEYYEILDDRYIEKIQTSFADDTHQLLKTHGAQENCYVLSFNEAVDGKELPLAEALSQVVGYGMPSIVICIPGKLAYFEAEQNYGPPPRFLLKRP